jgi:predicted MFS family arabinose efflux permease
MAVRGWLILVSVALARIGFGYQFQTVATLGPDLVSLFHLSYAELGTLIGSFMMSGAFAALPLGLLARRFGDRLILAGGLALMVVGALIAAWGGGPDGIVFGRVVSGLGAVAMVVLQGKIIADWFTGRQFMMAISVSVCSYPIGVGLAQLVLPPLAARYGWPSGFLSGGAMLAIALVLFVASYRPSPHLQPPPRAFRLPSGRECLLLAIAGLTWTAYTAGYAGYTSYVPSLMDVRGESLALTGLVMAIATWGNVPATMSGAGLAARFGGLRILIIGTAALVIGQAGTAWTDMPVFWAVIVGVLGSIHPGVIMAVGTLSARPENRAVGMGIFYALYYAGGSVGPTICGWAADMQGGPGGALLAAAAISALALPLFLLHRKLAHHETMLVRS